MSVSLFCSASPVSQLSTQYQTQPPRQFVSIQGLVEQEIGQIIFHKICEKAGVSARITPLPAKRAELALSQGKKDGEIMRIYDYGINKPQVIRVPTPYYQLRTMEFSQKQSPIVIDNVQSLQQHNVGIIRGVKHTAVITKNLPNITKANSTQQMMNLLTAGRIDVMLTSMVDGLFTLKQLGNDTITPQSSPLITLDLFIYVKKSEPELANQLNNTILAMQNSGELASIIAAAERQIIGE